MQDYVYYCDVLIRDLCESRNINVMELKLVLQAHFQHNAKIDKSQLENGNDDAHFIHDPSFVNHGRTSPIYGEIILMLETAFPFVLDSHRQEVIKRFIKCNDLYSVSKWLESIKRRDKIKNILQKVREYICERVDSQQMIELLVQYGLQIPSLDKMLDLRRPSPMMVVYILQSQRLLDGKNDDCNDDDAKNNAESNGDVDHDEKTGNEITSAHLLDLAEIIRKKYTFIHDRQDEYTNIAKNSCDILVLLLHFCGRQVKQKFFSDILEQKQHYSQQCKFWLTK